MVAAGKMRHAFAVQALTATTGSRGERVLSWSTVKTLRGDIAQLTGQELERAKRLSATATHTVTLRYTPDLALTTKHRLTHAGRTLNIGFVEDKGERHREWTVLVSEEL